MSVEGALFSTPRHRIEAHSESIVSSASSVSSLGFREPVSKNSPPKVALTEGSGLHSMECFVGSAQGVRFFGLVWREVLFVDLSGDML